MKFKRVLLFPLVLIPFIGLASCGNPNVSTSQTNQTPSQTTQAPSQTTQIPSTTTQIPSTTTQIPSTTVEPFDKDKGYDAVTKKCELTRKFEGKDFIEDGIGEATISQNVDGDTAIFKLKNTASATSVKIRFYAVDTPESTAKVDKWGKSASKFTASKLQPGVEIVLESTGAPAEHDSYGRYFAYVWYKDNGVYKNVNIEIVENGYSENRAVGTNPYYDYFLEAEQFASSHAMHIHSTDVDPNYNDSLNEVTIKTLKDDLNSGDPMYYDKESGVGAKIIVKAFIMEHTQGGTPGNVTHYFTIGQLDEDNKLSTFNVFAGYSSDPITSYLLVGSQVHLVGTVQKYSGQYQLAVGGTYVALKYDEKHTHILQDDYWCTFDSTAYGYDKKSETGVRGDVTVTSATLNGTTLTIVGNALTSSKVTEPTEFTFTVEVSSDYNYQSLIGKTLKINNALQEKYNSKQFKVLSISNIIIK